MKRAFPLQFRRNYLAGRFLTKTMSHNFALLIKSIKFIISYWRFIPAKLLLLCKKAEIILKLQKFTYQFLQYRFAALQFFSLFHKTPFYKLPEFNESNRQYEFTCFIQRHFPHFHRRFQKPSRCCSCSLDSLHLHLTSFLSSLFHINVSC